ncbi:DUF3152 domain-containing protein [Phytoactinopolyspora limicola]|uniref:DUF3152 domain-containing protein n=1 Tax=Phytoactinopolyspora limicola TaxID=2715536 RepID=UPI00140A3C5F|nr:DUF3152 domain-containing protein [Phytoactinopolyspora limicola]
MSKRRAGRYRPGAEARGTTWPVAAVAAALTLGAAAVLAASFSPPSGSDAPLTLLDGPARTGSPNADPSRDSTPSRGDGRSPLQLPEPTADATIVGPSVDGRTQPVPVDPPDSAGGSYDVVSGEAAPPDGDGDVVRYLVEVEDGLPFDAEEFAADVHTILNDERGWGRDGVAFERVDDGPVEFRVSLSSPDLTDQQCYPLLTRGEVSCWNGERAVINAKRWGLASQTYGDDILSYREYLINHEVGHALGHGHVSCPADGRPAPVMVQQTKSLEGCVANPWPYP